MIAPRANYGITRVDQPEKKNHGFYVRITHRGEMNQKFFADKTWEGKGKALKKAKAYRDEVLEGMPLEKQQSAARPKRKTPKSGVVGVTHVVSEARGNKYQYWQAAWADENGKKRTAKFSIRRYGSDTAKQMAIKARNRALREVRKAKNVASAAA